jgi:hypothetical protein
MEKVIEYEGRQLKFKATGATPIYYKNKFGGDLLVDMANVTNNSQGDTIPPDTLEKFGQIAYIMHKQGDPEQPDDFLEWLDQFEMFSIIEILPEILELWAMNSKQTSKPKKKGAR